MPQFRIINLADAPITPMKGGRGTQLRLINKGIGAEKVDVHLNRLDPKEPGGRYHHHTKADNVYIVKKGEGQLVVEDTTYTIREDDVIYIPAGQKHSLTNISNSIFEIFEIYSPAGEDFDFIIDD
jgi:putative monooxygenase